MHKIILAFGLVLLLITGCTTHNDVAEDPVRAELLKPAPPEKAETDADKEQNTEDKTKGGHNPNPDVLAVSEVGVVGLLL